MTYKVVSSAGSIILAPAKPVACLVWMHGLGDTCLGFKEYFEEKGSPLHDGVRVKLLQAPSRPVSINGGAVMPSWYDILALDAGPGRDHVSYEQVEDSCRIIDQQLASERELGLPLFLGGFSQGCVMALHYGLEKEQVRAVLGLSGYGLSKTAYNHVATPLLLQHGSQD
jgi:phospholipase/carboxylesterase